jgi:hypothetical protein
MTNTKTGIRAVLAAVVTGMALSLTGFAAPAQAAPTTPNFGPAIDAYAAYVGQSTCDPTPKPGVVEFKDLLQANYGNHTWGIARACDSGGQSEHKEGRALDYHFNSLDAADKQRAEDFLQWLFATDAHGNANAMARRFGLMYVCWNSRMWKAYTSPPGYGAWDCGDNKHVDHIHFSFGWAGARKQTSWWTGSSAPAVGRIGVLSGGTLSVKEGDLYASWVSQIGDVAKFEIDGDRIGVLTNGGEVLVKEGDLYAPWTTQMGGVRDFHLAGDRIGVVRTNGTLAVKDGTLQAGWVEEIGGVTDFDLTPTRVGVVTGGVATVKEGDLYASWVNQMGGIRDIELAGNRIGVVRDDNSLTVKDGTLQAGWVEQIGGVTDVELTPTRIGVVTGGVATVKEGDLYASWVNQMSGIRNLELSGNRVGLLRDDNSLTVKDGTLFASWVEQAGGVSQADLTHR